MMIYSMSNSILIPGKMAEWAEIAAKELNPLFPKLGMKMVGSWHSYTGDVNSTYTLFAWDDMAAFQKARQAQSTDKDYQKVNVKLNAVRVRQISTILEPNAWSPMK
jgi:hypothetical protein